jgi:hypothetical protein
MERCRLVRGSTDRFDHISERLARVDDRGASGSVVVLKHCVPSQHHGQFLFGLAEVIFCASGEALADGGVIHRQVDDGVEQVPHVGLVLAPSREVSDPTDGIGLTLPDAKWVNHPGVPLYPAIRSTTGRSLNYLAGLSVAPTAEVIGIPGEFVRSLKLSDNP